MCIKAYFQEPSSHSILPVDLYSCCWKQEQLYFHQNIIVFYSLWWNNFLPFLVLSVKYLILKIVFMSYEYVCDLWYSWNVFNFNNNNNNKPITTWVVWKVLGLNHRWQLYQQDFFFLRWYVCHKHPCEIAIHSIKKFVLYSYLKQECCLYPLKWIKLSIVCL